jgi:hypothetical protein
MVIPKPGRNRFIKSTPSWKSAPSSAPGRDGRHALPGRICRHDCRQTARSASLQRDEITLIRNLRGDFNVLPSDVTAGAELAQQIGEQPAPLQL